MKQKVDDTAKINKDILSEVDMDKDVDIFDLVQYDINDLFEYESVLYNDIEVKEEITSIVDFLLSYKKDILTNPFVKNWIKNK